MIILLAGISNVGKTSIGQELAKNLNYQFYDLDNEIKNTFQITLEQFMENNPEHLKRDKIKSDVLTHIVKRSKNSVIALSPFNYSKFLQPLFKNKNILPIELRDTPENIFRRLIFSDENDNIYKDDEYKNKHKTYYISEITADIYYYSKVYSSITAKYFINNKSIDQCAKELSDLIIKNKPIKIKLKLEDLIDIIIQSYDEHIGYYNILTHEMTYFDIDDNDTENYLELLINKDLYLELPKYDDFDEFNVLDNFVNTISDKNIKKEFLAVLKDLDHDFYENMIKLGINDAWDEYNNKAFIKFIAEWCHKNNLDYE